MKKHLLALSAFGLCSAATQDRFDAGQWEARMEISSIDAPDLPASAHAELRRAFAALGGQQCFAAAGDQTLQSLRNGLISGLTSGAPDATCAFSDRDKASGGELRMSASCRSASQDSQTTISLNGAYGPTRIEGDYEMTAGPLGQDPTIRIRGRITNRRIGRC